MKRVRGWGMSENASYKIVALLIALILWVIIMGSKEATLVKLIPIEYLMPKGMMITNNVPREVAFKLTGPRLTLKKFTEVADPLTIDLTSSMEGATTVRIHFDSINVPPGVRVTSVSPATVMPKLERIIEKIIPITINMVGELPDGKKLVSVSAYPNMWSVRGTVSSVEKMTSIKAKLDLSQIRSSLTKEVPLDIDDPGIIKRGEAKVKVQVTIQ